MAKLIKDLYPDVRIVFGGANFDGEMGLEYFRAFPFIDHVVVGEGEVTFPALVAHVLSGSTGAYPKGVTYRQDGKIGYEPNPALFTEFAQTGPPDYDDYYHLLANWVPRRHVAWIAFSCMKDRAVVGGARSIIARSAA